MNLIVLIVVFFDPLIFIPMAILGWRSSPKKIAIYAACYVMVIAVILALIGVNNVLEQAAIRLATAEITAFAVYGLKRLTTKS